MRHTLVGWAYRGQLEMHPHAPSLGIHGGATGAESPAGVEVTNAITRIGAARFDSAGEHPALSRGVATNRRGPRSRKRSWTRQQQGVLASDTCRVFGTTPCNNDSPRLGHFRTSALIQAEIAAQYGSITSSFVAPAGTKCGPASRCSKQSRSGTKARAGPASVETSGLSQKDSSHNWSPMMPGTNPLT